MDRMMKFTGGLIVSFSIMYLLNDVFDTVIPKLPLISMMFITYAAMYYHVQSKKSGRITLMLVAVGIIILVFPGRLEALIDFIVRIRDFLSGTNGLTNLDRVIFMMAVSIPYASLSARLAIRGRLKLTLLIFGIFIFAMWLLYHDSAYRAISIFAFGLILLYVDKATGRYESSSIGKKYYRASELSVYGILFALLVVLMANFFMWAYPLEKVNDWLSEYMPIYDELRSGYTPHPSSSIFSFKSTIYSPSGRLGGPVEPSEELMLRVYSDKPGLLLKGRVMTTYNGYMWDTVNRGYSSEFTYLTPDEGDYDVEIYYSNLITGTIFVPTDVKEIKLEREDVRVNSDEVFYYKKRNFSGALKKVTMVVSDIPVTFINTENLTPYLELASSVTDRTRQLAAEITVGAETDAAKVNLLSTYLHNNFEYALDTTNVPSDVDFVDYFLFEEERGYCTYFASAFVVMARAEGIPARYVEGFALPLFTSEDGAYHVTANLAHAWAEVYIKDIGWVEVDPTPGYQPAPPEIVDEPEEPEFDFEAYIERAKNYVREERVDEVPIEETTDETKRRSYSGYIYTASIIILLTALYFGLRYAKIKRRKSITKRLARLRTLMGRVSQEKVSTNVPETYVFEFAEKVLGRPFAEQAKVLVRKHLYSTHELDMHELELVSGEIDSMNKALLGKSGILAYAIGLGKYIFRR